MAASNPIARTQADRSAETKGRLIDAAIDCLIERGYSHATTVEICARANLTRGAYNHHYADSAELFLDATEKLYQRLAGRGPLAAGDDSLEALIHGGWERVSRPEFKALIELWLASRNDPALGATLGPAIARLSRSFGPDANPKLATLLDTAPHLAGIYRLAFEAMIGLALGRATSPEGAAVDHEDEVIGLLLSLARERGPAAPAKG